ncbi:MAG: DeoR/GlpR transcriptional regulator [Lachnospiraceae bacterium]|nr:DeoR/GlpR transcriptional regulator [Lachnospiraceae bacterium]
MSEGRKKIEARRGAILSRLRERGYVRVTDLSRELYVTEVTIRSDLMLLEQQGLLVRTQGGALPAKTRAGEPATPREPYAAEKRAIARAAATLIPDGSTLFINPGTTTLAFARALSGRRDLHIVTNSYPAAEHLGSLSSFRVILLGGELDPQFSFTTGDDAKEQLGRYQAERAVLSVDGISPSGITTFHAAAAALNRMMSERAGETLILADRSKIGRLGFSRICDIQPRIRLITDSGADPAQLEELKRAGLRITVAEIRE